MTPKSKTRSAETNQEEPHLYNSLNVHPYVPGVIVSQARICHPEVINSSVSSHWPGWCQLQEGAQGGHVALRYLTAGPGYQLVSGTSPGLAATGNGRKPQYRQGLKQRWDLSVPPVAEV